MTFLFLTQSRLYSKLHIHLTHLSFIHPFTITMHPFLGRLILMQKMPNTIGGLSIMHQSKMKNVCKKTTKKMAMIFYK